MGTTILSQAIWLLNTLMNKSHFLQQNYIQMVKDKQEQEILMFLKLQLTVHNYETPRKKSTSA